jgi:hypothetical protein
LVAGIDVLHQLINPVDIKGFRETIESAKDFLAGLNEEQFEGRHGALLTYQIAPDMQPTMPDCFCNDQHLFSPFDSLWNSPRKRHATW